MQALGCDSAPRSQADSSPLDAASHLDGAAGLDATTPPDAHTADSEPPPETDAGAEPDLGPPDAALEVDAAQPPDCPEDRASFAALTWPTLAGDCVTCHTAEGAARLSDLRLVPGDPEASFDSVRAIAQISVDGTPLLLAKPTEQVEHGGGRRFEVGDPGYRSLAAFVARVTAACLPFEPPPSCFEPGPSPLRLLTRREYDNTLRDLLGDDTRPALSLLPEAPRQHGFENNAHAYSVSDLHVEGYLELAEAAADRAVEAMDQLLPCELEDAACVQTSIAQLALRAFRRPATASELERLSALFDAARERHPPAGALALVIQVLLQSPPFLYRVEPAEALDPYAVASRLSYFLWASMPDQALFEAAAAGALSTEAEVRAQVERMLLDPRARETVASFSRQWLGLDAVEHLQREEAAFDPLAVQEAFNRFIDAVIWDGEGTLAGLLLSRTAFVNGPMAALYGLPAGEDWAEVELDPDRRAGLLTRPAFLAAHAYRDGTSPVKRGVFVREQILCQALPPPPPEVNVARPPPDPDRTTRERFEQHRLDPACAGCHVLIDPVGLGFEHYDQTGAWRAEESGRPVDASGELTQTDVDGDFVGALELSERLAESELVRDCMVRQWFRFARGREPTEAEACEVERLTEAFEASERDLRALIVALATSAAFRSRNATPIEGDDACAP